AVVVGAGSSSSTPKIACVVTHADCPSCKAAVQDPTSRSHRLNPSFLLQLRKRRSAGDPCDAHGRRHGDNNTSEPLFNILVDCGKSFRESAIKVFAPLGVSFIHSLLLTHPHADAILGLDDLREFSIPSRPTPVYLDAETEVQVRKTFNYLFPTEEAKKKKLWVASVDWRPMFEGSPVRPKGELLHGVLDVSFPTCTRPLPASQKAKQMEVEESPPSPPPPSSWPVSVFQVWHGVDTVSNAFVFPLPCTADGGEDEEEDCKVIVYLSDISVVKDDTLATIRRHIQLLHDRIRRDRRPTEVATATPQQQIPTAVTERPVDEREWSVRDEIPTAVTERPVDEREWSVRDDEAFLSKFVEVAIVDMLSEEPYISHLNTKEAVAAAKRIGAGHTYFVGMSHSLFYDNMALRIKELGGDTSRMELAWDGCVVYGPAANTRTAVNDDACD
ncbi:Hypothetical protein, putative, partial [Bodo saltans]